MDTRHQQVKHKSFGKLLKLPYLLRVGKSFCLGTFCPTKFPLNVNIVTKAISCTSKSSTTMVSCNHQNLVIYLSQTLAIPKKSEIFIKYNFSICVIIKSIDFEGYHVYKKRFLVTFIILREVFLIFRLPYSEIRFIFS